MADFNSKYKGSEVEALLDKVDSGELVTTNTEQTIAEHKTFSDGIDTPTIQNEGNISITTEGNITINTDSGTVTITGAAVEMWGGRVLIDCDVTISGKIVMPYDTVFIGQAEKRVALLDAGSTSSRPADVSAGYQYFDTTLGKPIWYDGSKWVNANGTAV